MATGFRVECPNCNLKPETDEDYVWEDAGEWVIDQKGKIVLAYHPDEDGPIEKATGVAAEKMRESGKVGYTKSYICGFCYQAFECLMDWTRVYAGEKLARRKLNPNDCSTYGPLLKKNDGEPTCPYCLSEQVSILSQESPCPRCKNSSMDWMPAGLS